MLKGIGVSTGIGIGNVFIKAEFVKPEKAIIMNIDEELLSLDEAVKKSEEDLKHIYQEELNTLGEEEAQIFQAHLMILNDPEFLSNAKAKIRDNQYAASYAVQTTVDEFSAMFEAMDNEYFRERAADIKDIGRRVIRKLMGIPEADLSSLEENTIIIAYDLTPSDTAQIDKSKVSGFVTEIGGSTSHSAIIARTLGIPAVMGVSKVTGTLSHGDAIIIDGDLGDIIVRPSYDEVAKYEAIMKKQSEEKEALKKYVGKTSMSKDGIRLEIASNIASSDDVAAVNENDSDGVGLFRSEFLYMNRHDLPNEEEQFTAYKTVLEGLDGKPVIIRTLDVGGDKEIPYLDFPEELNPFLGYRAVRYCLRNHDIFKTQLRALMRASQYGKLKIMFPMISSLKEVRDVKALLAVVIEELKNEGVPYDETVEIGIMIEIPSAAIISDILAKEVDFFSIGTNDLIQYTVAVDRMNENIKDLYTPYHPAVLRLVKTVIENGHKGGIWVGMCGSVAGNPLLIPVLLGMGLDEFSMSPSMVLKARKIMGELNKFDMEKIVDDVFQMETAEEIETFLKAKFN